MDEQINTSETLADVADVTPSDGLENDSQSQEVVSVKDLLSETLGRTFDDDASALKAVKDTFNFVGKAGKYQKAVEAVRVAKGFANHEQAIRYMENINQEVAVEPQTPAQPAIDPQKFVSREEFDQSTFYARNSNYEPYKDLIGALQKSTGKPLAEVVEMDTFKTVFQKATAHDEIEKSKSVLMSNPRIGAVSDKLTQAREALGQNNTAQANASAIDAVIESYNLRG